jgi:hypothetical protein
MVMIDALYFLSAAVMLHPNIRSLAPETSLTMSR